MVILTNSGIYRYLLSSEQNKAIVAALQQGGVNWPAMAVADSQSQPLKGETWVLTGTLESMGRGAEAKDKLLALGAKVAGSVSAKTSCVVAGASAGSKLTKAQNLGLNVMTEDQLLDFFSGQFNGQGV